MSGQYETVEGKRKKVARSWAWYIGWGAAGILLIAALVLGATALGLYVTTRSSPSVAGALVTDTTAATVVTSDGAWIKVNGFDTQTYQQQVLPVTVANRIHYNGPNQAVVETTAVFSFEMNTTGCVLTFAIFKNGVTQVTQSPNVAIAAPLANTPYVVPMSSVDILLYNDFLEVYVSSSCAATLTLPANQGSFYIWA